jgi:hypothetical protein
LVCPWVGGNKRFRAAGSKDHAPPKRGLAGDDVSLLFQGRGEADSFVGPATTMSGRKAEARRNSQLGLNGRSCVAFLRRRMDVVYDLWFTREYPDREDTELHIGIFSSEKAAQDASAAWN